MANKLYEESDIQAIANAIRSKNGSSDTYTLSQMATAVNALPNMSGSYAWLGKDVEQVSGEFHSDVRYLKGTSFNGWTPSTTAKTIITSSNKTAFSATDLDQWGYYIFWECGVDLVYDEGTTDVARPLFARGLIIQEIIRKAGSWAAVQAETPLTNTNQSAYAATFLRYYNDKGTLTYTWSASYGFYVSATAPAIASTSANTTNITPKTPAMSARCSTTYLSTGNAEVIDQDNSVVWIKGVRILRAKRDTYYDGVFRHICGLVNATSPTVPTTEN